MNSKSPSRSLFAGRRRLLIGVVHLLPLPGSPRWPGNLAAVVDHAVADAHAYARGGAHALFIENFGDVPFTKAQVPPETIAAMAVAGSAVREAVALRIGFNVLRNDAHAGLALCAACGGGFIRVNVHCGAMLTDQGIIEGAAFDTLRHRRRLCPNAEIFADVHVKHAVPVAPTPIEIAARDTLERGLADALIISGTGTGVATDLADVQRVRAACPRARILLGSGVTVENVGEHLRFADGVIVGSSLKAGGRLGNPVDWKRVAALAKVLRNAEACAPVVSASEAGDGPAQVRVAVTGPAAAPELRLHAARDFFYAVFREDLSLVTSASTKDGIL